MRTIPQRTSVLFFLLATGYWLLATPSSPAQDPAPLYKIEKDQVEKDGRAEDRLYVVRRSDAKGRSTLYVTVQFKVTRADGQPARDVGRDEVLVTEDGRRVTDLEIHSPAGGEPLTAVLALDISGSMAEHNKLEEAKQAARLFLDRLDPRASCGLILFDHQLRVQERPTKDRNRLRALIDGARPGGGTAYLDATTEAIRMLREVRGRRAVLLLTDGVDLNSKRTARDVIRQATTDQVPIYTIGVGEPGRNIPVTTVLVLDCSGSMGRPANDRDEISKMDALHRAASHFIDIMRPGARTTLLPFNDQVGAPKVFTADRQALKNEIAELTAEGGTRLFDATYTAVESLNAGRLEGKKAVIVLTDGMDEHPFSRHRPGEVIDRAREGEIPLHMLGFGPPDDIDEEVMRRMAAETGGTYHHARNNQMLFDIFENLSIQLHDDGIDEAALRTLADATGGKYHPARDISQLRFIYEDLAEELQNTYTVTFPSLRQDYDGTSRDIDISVWRAGRQVSDVLRAGYNVSGVVVPEMEPSVYLSLLAVLGGMLAVPAAARRLARRQPEAS